MSGSLDNTIKLWDAQAGSELRTFEGHSNLVPKVSSGNAHMELKYQLKHLGCVLKVKEFYGFLLNFVNPFVMTSGMIYWRLGIRTVAFLLLDSVHLLIESVYNHTILSAYTSIQKQGLG